MVKNKSPFEELYQNNEFKHLDLSLNRIIKALNEIAFDERDLGKIIHIAGTNGKGSTAKFISDMLLNEHYNVALYTSPHIVNVNERISYNGKSISDHDLDSLIFELKPILIENELSYFEALTLLAFKYFSIKKPHFSDIETGKRQKVLDKLPVITSISFDHADILGKNIYKIADEKLAIIKSNEDVFIGYNKPFVKHYITQQLNGKHVFFVEDVQSKLQYPYPYCYNYVLAEAVYYYLTGKKYNYFLPDLPPCRFETIGRIVFDGTHTINGLLELFKNFTVKPNIIFSLTKERNVYAFLNILKKFGENVVLTEIPDNDRSINIPVIDMPGINLIKNPVVALNYLKDNYESKCILITGSFYLCAYLRKFVTS